MSKYVIYTLNGQKATFPNLAEAEEWLNVRYPYASLTEWRETGNSINPKAERNAFVGSLRVATIKEL